MSARSAFGSCVSGLRFSRTLLYALALSRFVIADLRRVVVLPRLFIRPRPVVPCIAYYSVIRWAAASIKKDGSPEWVCRPAFLFGLIIRAYSPISARAVSLLIVSRPIIPAPLFPCFDPFRIYAEKPSDLVLCAYLLSECRKPHNPSTSYKTALTYFIASRYSLRYWSLFE